MAAFYSLGLNLLEVPVQGSYVSVGGKTMKVTDVRYDAFRNVQITLEHPKEGDPNLVECTMCRTYQVCCPWPQAQCCADCSHNHRPPHEQNLELPDPGHTHREV